MDKQHQRKGEKSNSQIGKEFETKILESFCKKGIKLEKPYPVEIGLGSKKYHEFDLGNKDTIVECKAMTWTKAENVPAAKMSNWNEAMYYFFLAPKKYKKYFFAKRHYSKKHGKTLLKYYIDTFAHLIPSDVVLYDYDTVRNHYKKYTTKDIKNRDKASMNNDINSLWEKILLKLDSKPMELRTIEERNLFSAYFKNGKILIELYSTKKIRSINKKDFTKIYQLWKKGNTQTFMHNESWNVSYIRALINHFEKEV